MPRYFRGNPTQQPKLMFIEVIYELQQVKGFQYLYGATSGACQWIRRGLCFAFLSTQANIHRQLDAE